MPARDPIQLRRGTSAEWAAANPVLAFGEPGYDSTLKIIKVGNGVTAWNSITDAFETGSGGGGGGGGFPVAGGIGTGYALLFNPYGPPAPSQGQNVNCGVFWEPGETNLGSMWWEYWSRPQNGGGANYVVSDGDGGAHAALLGWQTDASNASVTGNIWNDAGAAVVSFSSQDTVPVDTLHHVAIGFVQGVGLYVYLDGVFSGFTAYTGNRGAGSGVLYVGGSNHANLFGYIFRLRAYDGYLPFLDGVPANYFSPDWFFRDTIMNTDGTFVSSSFLMDLTVPGVMIPDQSSGYGGRKHNGILAWETNTTGTYKTQMYRDDDPGALAQFAVCPFERPAYAGAAPSATPGTALLFDEFRRQDSTPAWDMNPSVEARTSPTGQLWSGNMAIIGGKLWGWTNSTSQVEISHVQPNIDITFENGSAAAYPIVYVRKTDDNNYLAVNIQNFGGPQRAVLTEVIGGVGTQLAVSADLGSNSWNSWRIVANGANVNVERNGASVIAGATTTKLDGIIAAMGVEPRARMQKIVAYAA